LLGLRRGDARGEGAGREQRPQADLDRDHGAHGRRCAEGARRPLRRDEGAARRGFPPRRGRSRRRPPLGGTLPRRAGRRGRGAAGLDDVSEAARRAAEGAARQSYGKLVAYLAARTGDVATAEDALSDAFAAALATWPERGVPETPEAWLLAAARRRMID